MEIAPDYLIELQYVVGQLDRPRDDCALIETEDRSLQQLRMGGERSQQCSSVNCVSVNGDF